MENIAAYIRDGKFYDTSGQEVPLEIGNREQIDLLKKYESPLPDPTFTCTVSEVEFEIDAKCHCGSHISASKTSYPDSESWNEQDESEIGSRFEGSHLVCRNCKQEYKVVESDKGGYVLEKFPPITDPRGIILREDNGR